MTSPIARAKVPRAMTFGWIGYVLALLGCGTVAGGFFAGAVFLYAVGRRAEARGPKVRVESVSTERSEDENGGPGAG